MIEIPTHSQMELAVRIADLDVWVSLADAHMIIQDQLLTGTGFVVEIPDLPPDALITHRRLAPDEVAKAR